MIFSNREMVHGLMKVFDEIEDEDDNRFIENLYWNPRELVVEKKLRLIKLYEKYVGRYGTE